MKKLFLSAMALVAATTLSVAQEIDFGVQAGANFATLTGDQDGDTNHRNGINVGITGEYMFNNSFGLFAGAIYSQQGFENESTISFGDVIVDATRTLKLDYINVPVLAKFYLGNSGFSIDAGPQIGFLVNDEDEFESNDNSIEVDAGDAETIDLSVGGGLSYKFLEGTTLEGLSLSARYMRGFTNVYKDSDVFSDDLNNSVISVNLGYKF